MAAGLDAMQDITSEAGPSQSQLTQEVTVDPEELEMNGETAGDGQAPKLSKSAMKKAARKVDFSGYLEHADMTLSGQRSRDEALETTS
jgi:hypothetical protein